MGKVISAHAVVFLEVADDGLDGGPPFEFALDLRRDAALLAARVDLELVIGWGVVAAIAGIGDAAMEDVADERLHLRNDRGECVPVIGIAGQCCGMGDELPAGGMLHRGSDAHLDFGCCLVHASSPSMPSSGSALGSIATGSGSAAAVTSIALAAFSASSAPIHRVTIPSSTWRGFRL